MRVNAYSLGFIIPHSQSISGHVVQVKMWGLDKNSQKWDKSETTHAVVYKTSVYQFKVKNHTAKRRMGRES